MSDNEHIRKAVELADGWSWSMLCALEKSVLTGRGTVDALAAQLVRQVDALNGRYRIQIHSSRTIIFKSRYVHFEESGVDRAINTINAIVDSEVLTPVVQEQRSQDD